MDEPPPPKKKVLGETWPKHQGEITKVKGQDIAGVNLEGGWRG